MLKYAQFANEDVMNKTKTDKLVIFDWCGVVFDLKNIAAMKHLWQQALNSVGVNISLKDVESWWQLWHFNMLTKDTSEINTNFAHILKTLGINPTYQQIRHLRLAMDEAIKNAPVHQPIADMIRQLIYDGNCLVGLLSNTEIPAIPALSVQLPIAAFDYVWLSFEQGLAKPDMRLYEKVEKESGLSPHDIMFIEDSPENLQPAVTRGWKTYLVDETIDDNKKVLLMKNAINEFLDNRG